MQLVEAGGVRLFPVGLGTWQFGSREWAYGSSYAENTAPAILNRSLDLGVNLIDTAEIYAFGRSERIVGASLGTRRDEAFLATKILPVLPVGPVVGWRARGSLRRLATDRIDLYQLHWPNPVVPARLIAPPLRSLLDEGIVGHVGVSNYPLAAWQELERELGVPVLSNQVSYNLLDRRPEHELLPWAKEHGRLIIAYSPLAQGLLSGRYGPGRMPAGLRARTTPFLPQNVAALQPLLDTLGQVGAAHGANAAQVALAWCMRRTNVVVIPGASSVEQVEMNAASADIELTEEEDDALTRASDAYRPVSGPAAVVRARAEVLGTRLRKIEHGLRT
jgi:aryl-alcohol dehydrogenase-like predicted oxidoreductase